MATVTYPEGAASALSNPMAGDVQSPSVKRISWSAILAGVTVAVAVQLALSLLGAGIGFGLVDPLAGDTPGAGSFGLGAGLWWLVSNLLALAAGGYTAAWLAGNTLRFDGMLHGIVTWGVTLLLTFYLLTTAIGGLIGGAFGMVGGVASGATSAAGEGLRAAAPQVAAMTSVTPDQMLEQAKAYLQPANPDPAAMTPEAAQKELAMAMPKLAAGGDQAKEARERIISIMAVQLKISPDEAAKRFDEAQAQLTAAKNEAMQSAKVAADATAGAASKAAFLAFVALVLGAAAAAFGGSLAVQRRVAFVAIPSAAVGSAEFGCRGGWPRGLPVSAFAYPTRGRWAAVRGRLECR